MTDLRKFRIRLIIIIGLFIVATSGIWFAIISTDQKEQLKARGEAFNEGFAIVEPKNGKDGESAYDIAKRHGFTGSESEWVELQQGKDGLSSYQIAVLQGFTGSQVDWLAFLKGERGEVGPKGETGQAGANGANGKDGAPGPAGKDGQAGINGTNGTDGRTPEYTCRDNTTYWKYTNEDEAAWRPWFTVVSCSQPPPEEVTE